jgi:hypothetical protein
MLPPTGFALVIALAFRHAGTGDNMGRTALEAAAGVIVEGIWPLLIVTTVTLLVGTLSVSRFRNRLEQESKR